MQRLPEAVRHQPPKEPGWVVLRCYYLSPCNRIVSKRLPILSSLLLDSFLLRGLREFQLSVYTKEKRTPGAGVLLNLDNLNVYCSFCGYHTLLIDGS